MQKEIRESALGRPLDPNYLTNRIILIITPIFGILAGAYTLFTSWDLWLAVQAGFWMSGSVFGAWAMSREIDHDNDWSAFLAVAFAVIASFYYGFPALAVFALGLSLQASRMVSRIVGIPATLPESAVILLVAALGIFLESWVLMFVAIFAFVMDAILSNPNRYQWGFAAAGVALLIIRVIMGIGETSSLSNPYLISLIVLSIGFVITILSTRKMRVTCDNPQYTLDIRRIWAAMSLGLITAVLTALWGGDKAMIALLPLWSAIAATILYRIPVTIREFLNTQQRQTRHEPSH